MAIRQSESAQAELKQLTTFSMSALPRRGTPQHVRSSLDAVADGEEETHHTEPKRRGEPHIQYQLHARPGCCRMRKAEGVPKERHTLRRPVVSVKPMDGLPCQDQHRRQ